MHSAVRMRALLGKLGQIAAKYNCAMVLVSYMNKSGTGNKLYRGCGSIDIAATARSVLMISRDDNDASIRCVAQVKSSLAPEGTPISLKLTEPVLFSGYRAIRCVRIMMVMILKPISR